MTIYLPAMKVAQGEPFAYDFTVTGQSWTGYTGTATFKTAPQARSWRRVNSTYSETALEPIVSVTATGDSSGVVQFSLTGTQTALFPAQAKLGYRRQAVCEISMTNGADTQKFQCRVSVASAV